MKIVVPIKRVIDPYVVVRVKPDGSGVVTENVKTAINPFDEIAVEEAVRLREQNSATEVIVASIGPVVCRETLINALALGADRALLIEATDQLEPLNIAKVLQVIVMQQQPGLVLMGKQTIDGDHNQTGQMLAGLLSWPQATFASKITLQNNQLDVVREVDGGLETLQLELPAIVTTDLRLNEPRYITLPNIMKAKRKPFEVLALDSLGVDLKQHIELLKCEAPTQREAGIKVADVAELVQRLQNEAKVL